MIFSILAFITLVLSICIKNREKSLNIQSLSCLFEAIYDFSIQAFTGAFLNIINFIRSSIFKRSEKINKKLYFFIFIFFEGIIISNCIYTWNGLISILPTLGSVIRTYCLWQTDMKLVRISGMTTGICYGLYYLYYKNVFIISGYIILLIVSIINFYKNDIKIKENNT